VKNKLSDLNNHLFAQLERLSEEGLKGEALTTEIQRSNAIKDISREVISNARLVLDAEKLKAEYDLKSLPLLIESKDAV
jgi:selenophosphate synthetase-related protein